MICKKKEQNIVYKAFLYDSSIFEEVVTHKTNSIAEYMFGFTKTVFDRTLKEALYKFRRHEKPYFVAKLIDLKDKNSKPIIKLVEYKEDMSEEDVFRMLDATE